MAPFWISISTIFSSPKKMICPVSHYFFWKNGLFELPFCAAKWSTVSPSVFATLTFAPFWIKRPIILLLPFRVAACNAVSPTSFVASTFTPLWMSSNTDSSWPEKIHWFNRDQGRNICYQITIKSIRIQFPFIAIVTATLPTVNFVHWIIDET